jgi:hypothetical protein
VWLAPFVVLAERSSEVALWEWGHIKCARTCSGAYVNKPAQQRRPGAWIVLFSKHKLLGFYKEL